VLRELARLEKSGLVNARRVGNRRHYQANAGSPLLDELRSIVDKTVGLADRNPFLMKNLGLPKLWIIGTEIEALPGFLLPDAGSQARRSIQEARLRALCG